MPNKKRGAPHHPAEPIVEIIVRRGALRRFDRLQKAVTDLPVKLSWDRRLQKGRTSSSCVEREQRHEDRRKAPPFTWEAADFVVVDTPAHDESA